MAKRKTDEEILFALKRCGTDEYKSCDQCPYSGNFKNCIDRMTRDAASLIKSQYEDIEKLQSIIDGGAETCDNCHSKYAQKIETAKAEAIKEFAERLKKDISNHRLEMLMNGLKGTPRTREITYECVEEYIDNLVEEMVGDAE